MKGKAIPAPKGDGEIALAKQDPLTFALLKYAGGALPDQKSVWGKFDTETSVANHAKKLAGDTLGKMMLKDPAKFQRLQALMAASGDVRADFVQTEIDKLLKGRTPEQIVEDAENNHADCSEMRFSSNLTIRTPNPANPTTRPTIRRESSPKTARRSPSSKSGFSKSAG